MQISRVLTSTLVFGTFLGVSATAWSEEPAPAAPATPAPAAAPEAAPAPAPAPAEAMAPAPAAPEAAPAGPTGPAWVRIDSDGLGLQLWAGTTNTIGGINLATDIYVGESGGTSYGEFDIGPAFAMGDLSLTPMIGLNFDWGAKNLASVVPQFYTIYNGDPLYFESWIQVFLNSIPHSGGYDTIYTRDFLLFKATHDFRIGPAVEATIAINTPAKDSLGSGKTLASLPIGGTLTYNALGDWKGQIIAFLGVETQKASKTGDNLVGRLTYLQSF